MRPFARPLLAVTLALLAVRAGSLGAQGGASSPAAPAGDVVVRSAPRIVAAAPTVVLLVRHAEKAPTPADDPPLSPAGSERARALAAALGDAGVTAVVVTPRLRTRATAQPLADARGLVPEVVSLGGTTEAHAQAVAAAVRRHAGGVVLVVGHSNTVPAIVAALGGPRPPELCDAEYSNLYVLVLDAAGAERSHLVRSHYGAADAAGAAGCAAMQPR